eukprot:s4563_g1.t1
MTDMCGTAAWQHERQTSKPDIGFISRSPSAFSHRLYSSMALACASMDLPEDAHERTMHLPEDPEDNDFEVFVDANVTWAHLDEELLLMTENSTRVLGDKGWTMEPPLRCASDVQPSGVSTGQSRLHCPRQLSRADRYAIQMHRPETWGILQFEDSLKEWPSRGAAMAVYYAQHAYAEKHGGAQTLSHAQCTAASVDEKLPFEAGAFTTQLPDLMQFSSDPFPVCALEERLDLALEHKALYNFPCYGAIPVPRGLLALHLPSEIPRLQDVLRDFADSDNMVSESSLRDVAGFTDEVADTLAAQLGPGPWHVEKLEQLFSGATYEDQEEEPASRSSSPAKGWRSDSPRQWSSASPLRRRHTVGFASEAPSYDADDLEDDGLCQLSALVQAALRGDEEATKLQHLLRRTWHVAQGLEQQRHRLQDEAAEAHKQAKLQTERVTSAENARVSAEAAEAAALSALQVAGQRQVASRELIKRREEELEEARLRSEGLEAEMARQAARLRGLEGGAEPPRAWQSPDLDEQVANEVGEMWKVRPAHSCFGCCTLTVGVEATCFLSLLVQITILSLCSSAETLSLMGLKVSPEIQVICASWALAGMPVVIAAGVGVLYHVDHLLRTLFWYLVISFPLGISMSAWLLLSGKVCDSVVEDEIQRLGSVFVCGIIKERAQESFVFMWTTVAALLHAYLIYVVWSAAEEITEMTYNSVSLSAYSNKLQFMASMGPAAPEVKSVPVMNPGVSMAFAHSDTAAPAVSAVPQSAGGAAAGNPQSFFPAPTSDVDFKSAVPRLYATVREEAHAAERPFGRCTSELLSFTEQRREFRLSGHIAAKAPEPRLEERLRRAEEDRDRKVTPRASNDAAQSELLRQIASANATAEALRNEMVACEEAAAMERQRSFPHRPEGSSTGIGELGFPRQLWPQANQAKALAEECRDALERGALGRCTGCCSWAEGVATCRMRSEGQTPSAATSTTRLSSEDLRVAEQAGRLQSAEELGGLLPRRYRRPESVGSEADGHAGRHALAEQAPLWQRMVEQPSGPCKMRRACQIQYESLLCSKAIEDMHWPYWYLLAICCSVGTMANGLVLWWQGVSCPKLPDVKWIFARALFENLHWMLAIYAVLVGAAPGDVAALTSIDIIAAALLGLIFLGERVSMLHFLALVLSVAGALFISQPQFLFGITEGSKQSPLGYCLAMLAGCFQAGAFVCARKSTHIPVSLLTVLSLFLSVPLALVPPSLGLHSGSEDGLKLVTEKPWQALALLSAMTAWVLLSIMLPAAGATRCPAAVSATVFTSASMISGYAAQTVLMNDAPKPLKLLGATCMLFSVVIMAIRCQPAEEPEPSCADFVPEPTVIGTASTEDDETQSLGSFVASEVSFASSSSLRRRSSTGNSKPLPQRLGACLPGLPVVQLMSGGLHVSFEKILAWLHPALPHQMERTAGMSTAQPLLPKTSIFESLARNPKVSRFISTAAEAKDDPKLQETLEKLKPWVLGALGFARAVVQGYFSLYSFFYDIFVKLPADELKAVIGLVLCFFGGVYVTLIAAVEAFRTMGGQSLYDDLAYVKLELDNVAWLQERSSHGEYGALMNLLSGFPFAVGVLSALCKSATSAFQQSSRHRHQRSSALQDCRNKLQSPALFSESMETTRRASNDWLRVLGCASQTSNPIRQRGGQAASRDLLEPPGVSEDLMQAGPARYPGVDGGRAEVSRRLRLAAASTARPGCASARGWALTKLVGQACLPQVWRKVLCQGPANESDVADNQGTNAAIGFAQHYKAFNPNAFKDAGGTRALANSGKTEMP